jgi:hypothetical protein
MYDTLGEVVSLSTCNRLVWEVAAQVKALKSATIAGPPAVVMVDGMWGKSASPTGAQRQDAPGRLRSVKRKEKRVVLSALGLWEDGHGEIVHWPIAPGENQACWHHFLGDLYRNGSTEETPQLVVREGSKGLERALDSHDYGVPHQQCLFHKIKHLTDHLVCEE